MKHGLYVDQSYSMGVAEVMDIKSIGYSHFILKEDCQMLQQLSR